MESHGCRLLREPPWLANTQRATAPSGSDYCLIEFSLMSGRSPGPPLTVDSVIKHKNKTLAFHLGASRRGRQTPCMASFGDHLPVTPVHQSLLCPVLLLCVAPFCLCLCPRFALLLIFGRIHYDGRSRRSGRSIVLSPRVRQRHPAGVTQLILYSPCQLPINVYSLW